MADTAADEEIQTAASPPRKRSKITGAAKYGTKYQQKWEEGITEEGITEFTFVSRSTTSEYSFLCRTCCKDVSCQHPGKADVRRHEKSGEHQARVRSTAGSSSLQQLGFVPIGTQLDSQV